ncbi:MAG: BRCT domain-containing protein [Microscillaceae bacterium]|nr:BRCT domain-containing protein [Microscillaceae bacterium]
MAAKFYEGLKSALKSPLEVRELSLDGYREKNLAALADLPNLESLKLLYYKTKDLESTLPHLPQLKRLVFGWGEKNCPEVLFTLQGLVYLEFMHSPIKAIPASIGNLQNLEVLDLNFLQLQRFPEGILRLKKLKKLILDNNKLESLPDDIDQLEQLTDIFLMNNRIKELPLGFALLPLNCLDLGGNSILEQTPISSKTLQDLFRRFRKQNLSSDQRRLYLQLLLGNFKKAEKIAGKKAVLWGLNGFFPEIRRNAARYFYRYFENPFENNPTNISEIKLCILGKIKEYKRQEIKDILSKEGITLQNEPKPSTTHLVLGEYPYKKLHYALDSGKPLIAAGHLCDYLHTLQGYYLMKEDAETDKVAGKILSLLNSGEESNQKLALELAFGGGIHKRFQYEIILLYIWSKNDTLHRLAGEVLEKHLPADVFMDFKSNLRIFDNYLSEETLAGYLKNICGTRLDPNELGIRVYKNYQKGRLFCMQYPRSFLEICKLEIKYNVLYLNALKLKKIHPCIVELPEIKFLYANHNRLSELPGNLGQLESLSYLYLHNNAFKIFPEALLQLKNLKKLSLHVNQIREIPKEIDQLNQLEHLYLRSNLIERLPESFACLTNLQLLILEKNPIAKDTKQIRRLQEMLPNCQIKV